MKSGNNMTEKIILYATKWCWSSRRAKEIIEREGFECRWVDIDEDNQGREFVEKTNNGNRSVPTIVFPDGSVLTEPLENELLKQLQKIKKG